MLLKGLDLLDVKISFLGNNDCCMNITINNGSGPCLEVWMVLGYCFKLSIFFTSKQGYNTLSTIFIRAISIAMKTHGNYCHHIP